MALQCITFKNLCNIGIQLDMSDAQGLNALSVPDERINLSQRIARRNVACRSMYRNDNCSGLRVR